MNMVLFGTAVVTGGMLLQPLFGRFFSGGAQQVGAIDAVQLINRRDALVIDIRDKADFAAGHVPNALNVPLPELEGRLKELEKYKSQPVIVSCQTGARAAGACGTLKKSGFAEVFTLREGLRGWTEANLPLEKKK